MHTALSKFSAESAKKAMKATFEKTLLFILILMANFCHGEDKSVFVGLIIHNNNDALIPYFLDTISEMEYEKSSMKVRVVILNDNPDVYSKTAEWCKSFSDKYSAVSCEKSSLKPSEIKNCFLSESDGSEFLFITSSDVFMKPFTLRTLAQKNLPIIVPLLRPLPKPNDPHRNFYLSADEKGFFKDHPDYHHIAERKKLGTFKADCAHGAYLIQSKYAYKLEFDDGSPWDFIAFSNAARANRISQFICNEREFGFFIHQDNPPRDQLIPSLTRKVTRENVFEIASKFKQDNPLQAHIKDFPIDHYSLYSVEGDLYWVDEKWDWIKSYYIKKGLKWEPHIEQLFKKYVKAGDTVIDIGGHIGSHTITLSRCVGPQGTVHVFEPQAKMHTELLVNTALNHCNNINYYRVALGSENKETHIKTHKTNEGIACISQEGENISMKTLDSFNFSRVSLIKIDVEGYEIEALKGGLETIQRNKPVMIIEVFGGEENEKKLNFIRALGYDISHLEYDDYLCTPKQQ